MHSKLHKRRPGCNQATTARPRLDNRKLQCCILNGPVIRNTISGQFARIDPQKNLKDTPAYEQRRVDLATFRALPGASTWGHCSQVLCFTIVWDTHEREKVAKWSPAPASILEGFNEI